MKCRICGHDERRGHTFCKICDNILINIPDIGEKCSCCGRNIGATERHVKKFHKGYGDLTFCPDCISKISIDSKRIRSMENI